MTLYAMQYHPPPLGGLKGRAVLSVVAQRGRRRRTGREMGAMLINMRPADSLGSLWGTDGFSA